MLEYYVLFIDCVVLLGVKKYKSLDFSQWMLRWILLQTLYFYD